MSRWACVATVSIVLFLSCLAVSCSSGRMEADVDAVATLFYENIQEGDYAAVSLQLDDTFTNRVSPAEFAALLAAIYLRLGDPLSFERVSFDTESYDTQNGKRYLFTLVYNVRYSSFDATETLSLVKEPDDDTIRIQNYVVSSIGLSPEATGGQAEATGEQPAVPSTN